MSHTPETQATPINWRDRALAALDKVTRLYGPAALVGVREVLEANATDVALRKSHRLPEMRNAVADFRALVSKDLHELAAALERLENAEPAPPDDV